ncbi:methyltransferase domain-containing protein [Candidatus Thorarchaeota archaeon]|nr:MAG: methyltransferase domain-containing protein [Candidatus Thorarchaeota archaeon]
MREKFEIAVLDGVYPPSEDTYLLIDSLTIESEDLVLDVGCGAGVATLVAAEMAKRVLSLDISLEAANNTRQNLRMNSLGKNVSVIQSDLFSSISPETKFSLILFNPPYLPKDEYETDMDHALVGGGIGTELTQRFIIEASQHLIEGGRIYVVASSLADVETINAELREQRFDITIENEESIFFERIQVIKGTWQGHKETVL